MDSWKIHQFNGERADIVAEVIRRTLLDTGRNPEAAELAINDVAFQELARLEGTPKHTQRMRAWTDLYRRLGKRSPAEQAQILRQLTTDYARDIVGSFNPNVYRFATSIIPRGLSLLFRRRALSNAPRMEELERRIQVRGKIEELRQLAKIGTVILVPTHSSNLDSIVLGFALDRLGLPPVTYGAGKNLFSNRLVGYFMHNLGAYRVDRRLKNELYKNVLKNYSSVILERGFHSLFFPGGTRSRSGAVEQKLKLGLLGTGLSAYINNILQNRPNPNIFIVPVTINYPLVLEAASQIDDHLKAVGKSRYIIEDDEFSRVGRIWSYARAILNFDGHMVINIAPALDPLGNPVDQAGRSLDPHGRPIELHRYLLTEGVFGADARRDAEYTRECGEAICRSFQRHNVILSTHLAAFTLFELLRVRHPQLELYRLLRLTANETLPIDLVETVTLALRIELLGLVAEGKIEVSDGIRQDSIEHVLERAFGYFQMYHSRPLVEQVGEEVRLVDLKLLYYYHNRLAGYGLEKFVKAASVEKNTRV